MKNSANWSEKSTDTYGVRTSGTRTNLGLNPKTPKSLLNLLLNFRQAVRLACLAFTGACVLGALNPATTSAASPTASVDQLKYIQVLVQLLGDGSLFSSASTPAAYAQWAIGKGMEPSGGWKPTAKLSSDILAQTLVQLYGLNPRKFGGDFYRILERDGIVIGRAKSISSEYLAALIDNPTFALKTQEVAGTQTSPHKPDDDDKHGGGGGKDDVDKPKPRDRKPPPSPGKHNRKGKVNKRR